MLPTIHQDVWIRATEDDWRKALALLDRLPSRATSSAAFDQRVYFLALDGTTRFGVEKATVAILQNALGHAFFPSPPELRGQCDKAMEPHEHERERIWQREKSKFPKDSWEPQQQTPEGRARVARAYAEFCKSYEKPAEETTTILDPELVAQVPDNPKFRDRHGVRKSA